MSRHETSPTTVQPASNHRPNACCFCWCCCCSCSWYVPPPTPARGSHGAASIAHPISSFDIQGSRKQGRRESRPRVAGSLRAFCGTKRLDTAAAGAGGWGSRGRWGSHSSPPPLGALQPFGAARGARRQWVREGGWDGTSPAHRAEPPGRSCAWVGLGIESELGAVVRKGVNGVLEQMGIGGATVCCSPPDAEPGEPEPRLAAP